MLSKRLSIILRFVDEQQTCRDDSLKPHLSRLTALSRVQGTEYAMVAGKKSSIASKTCSSSYSCEQLPMAAGLFAYSLINRVRVEYSLGKLFKAGVDAWRIIDDT